MSYGIETYIDGVPVIQSMRPYNLVYAVRVLNGKASPTPINIPIDTGVADGDLKLVVGDFGYYDKTESYSGTGQVVARSISFTASTLTMTLESLYGFGGPVDNAPLVFNFFRVR